MTVDNETSDQQVIFATGGYDHTIKLWQPHTGNCERTFTETEFVSFYFCLTFGNNQSLFDNIIQTFVWLLSLSICFPQ